MKILIVGLGSIGTRHAKNFSQLGYDNLVGFDPLPDRRRVFKKELSCKVVSTLDDGLNEQPDLCVIASPNCFHIEQAITAAKHGCHLFIEKPLSNSRYYLPELTQTVKDKDLFVHVGSNWKFHPAFKTMKKILSDQILGKITGTQILAGQWLPDWHPWEDYRNMYSSRKSLGGGVVLDSHEFDYVSWLLGKIKKVYGFVQHTGILEIETEDVAVACLEFESGILGTVHIDYIQRFYRRRYHISGENGTLEWDYTSGNIILSRVGYDEEVINVKMDDINNMYLLQSQHIINGVLGKEQPVTSLEDASQVLEVLLKIKNE